MNAYELALDQARTELGAAQAEQRRLGMRISQLEAVVTQLQALVTQGNVHGPSPLFEAPDQHADNGAKQTQDIPLWKAILNSLNGDSGDFTVPQALRALERTGRFIPSKNRLNIIRNTLIQREDIFARLGTGHYCVRGFEGKKKEGERVSED